MVLRRRRRAEAFSWSEHFARQQRGERFIKSFPDITLVSFLNGGAWRPFFPLRTVALPLSGIHFLAAASVERLITLLMNSSPLAFGFLDLTRVVTRIIMRAGASRGARQFLNLPTMTASKASDASSSGKTFPSSIAPRQDKQIVT